MFLHFFNDLLLLMSLHLQTGLETCMRFQLQRLVRWMIIVANAFLLPYPDHRENKHVWLVLGFLKPSLKMKVPF